MSAKPVVSVIIPAYNAAKYLDKSIQSVLDQEGLNKEFELEVIVVDDGSDDGTDLVAARFAEHVHYARINNSGRPSVPRNFGARIAKGDYLAFLDADDVWLTSKLIVQLAQFKERPELALVSTNAIRIDEAGNDLEGLVVLDELLPVKADIVSLIKLNYICTSATVVKAGTFRNLGGFNEALILRAVEDYELWIRVAAVAPIEYLHDPLVQYRVHEAATSKHGAEDAWMLMLAVYSSVKKSVGRVLGAEASITLDQQMANAHHDLYKLSGILGKLRHGLAYVYLRLVLRIKYIRK